MTRQRSRRIVVAYIEVETPQGRMFRHAATGATVDQIVAEGRRPQPLPFHDEGHTPEGRYRYWCAADRPQVVRNELAVAPIHRTSKVPADAECETCGINIRELQRLMGEAVGKWNPPA